ncbi:Retrovirus-related Pol polyprotein LINE-1 [Artemisia annua]|uniref:Retrovirus-related Pol polyprotein LINE-1 n=1 Tax=Artemisia annua TaxID=35608 RepID=A0A2U1LMQ3_ARTAN|nr:Retrovirus-related Pol polyprotein LINE-1 [Artemisia annua]
MMVDFLLVVLAYKRILSWILTKKLAISNQGVRLLAGPTHESCNQLNTFGSPCDLPQWALFDTSLFLMLMDLALTTVWIDRPSLCVQVNQCSDNKDYPFYEPEIYFIQSASLSKFKAISQTEIKEALRNMGRNKVFEPDEIPIEALRCLGDDVVKWLTLLFNKTFSRAKKPKSEDSARLSPYIRTKETHKHVASARV